MKKLFISLLTALSISALSAQNNTVQNITVESETDKEDLIGLPEGMLSETDSLYLDWISKH